MRRQLPPLALEVRQLRDLLPIEEASVSVQELPIRVYCRFRAQNESEEFRGGKEAWESSGNPSATVNLAPSTAATLGPVPEYTFDRVFGPEASQDDLYAEVLPLLQEVLEDGGNGSILCYGQTSAGKTFTIEGEEGDLRGILPRALETVFAQNASLKDASVHISMLEIYMERLRDLLIDGTDLSIAEDRHQGVVVRGLQEVPVQTLQHAMEVWHHGRQQRITATTGMNDRSSRSHCIVTLHVAREGVVSKLSIVDLAGSECVKKICMPGKSAANKETVEEAKAINQSLSTLGLVINRLAKSKGRNRSSCDVHVPYRSSKLTRVLQDSLGGGSRTVLLLNCSISSSQVAETLSTLRFGTRARSCVNVASTESCEEPMLLKTLRLARQELQRLQARAWPREAEDDDDTPFSGLSALSHEQESVSLVEFGSPEAQRPRFVQHGLELSLVQEAESDDENEVPCPRLSVASGFRRSVCSRRTSRRMSRQSRQSTVAACSNPASLPASPRWLEPSQCQGLYLSSVSFCGGDRQIECWEHPLTKSEKRSRLISILTKELSGAETELQDVQALADDLHRRCDALQAEVEYLRVELDPATVKSGIEDPQVRDLCACCAALYVESLVGRLSKQLSAVDKAQSPKSEHVASPRLHPGSDSTEAGKRAPCFENHDTSSLPKLTEESNPKSCSMTSDDAILSVDVSDAQETEVDKRKLTNSVKEDKEDGIDEVSETTQTTPRLFAEDQQSDASLPEQLMPESQEPMLNISRPQGPQEDGETRSWLPYLTAVASLAFGYAG